MENEKKQLINILKDSLNNSKYKNIECNNWNEIFQEAIEHDLSSLVYYTLDKSILNKMDEGLLNDWKKDVFFSNVHQIKTINEIYEVISDLVELGVEIICLKGLVLRDYYPKAELRTMNDGDILVHKEDFSKVSEYLLNRGYKCKGEINNLHEVFYSENTNNIIEVHWKLVNENYTFKNTKEFEENLWTNSIAKKINGVNVRVLSSEDSIIHLCFHMAVHARYSGFGLRQIFDLAVFIENEKIDWFLLMKRAEQFGITRFLDGMLVLLNKYFDVVVPRIIIEDTNIKKEEVEIFINFAYLCGNNGKKNEIEDFKYLARNGIAKKKECSNFLKVARFIIPTKTKLKHTYKGADKFTILLPFYAIHYIFKKGVINKYGIVQCAKNISESLAIGNNRRKFLITFDI
ncbi:MAG: nucleotidyltransferase family protein [Clostridiales bacterium]|nr:nucleotidyltransferase family protein [Clostridiales bacterium]